MVAVAAVVALVFVVSNLDSIVITRRHIAEVCVCLRDDHDRDLFASQVVVVAHHHKICLARPDADARKHYLPVYNV